MKFAESIVESKCFECMIMIAIVSNTVLVALESPNESNSEKHRLEVGKGVFTVR